MIVDSIRSEYQRYKSLAERALAQAPEDTFHTLLDSEHTDDNSIAIIMQHVSGNLKSRFSDFLTADGEKPWRQRDSEFEDQDLSVAELMQRWQEAWEMLFNVLEALEDADLDKQITIRGNQLSIAAALHRSLAHTSYHVGQIVLLARIFAGENWQSLTIPRGQSEVYNKNPSSG
jgi:hypothetical protein